ncbi:hypothetical protein Fcan01_19896 [Folsomia candida]|uniref:Odorant receptor n=1 Tax=Folsomia candida TaxID=158441 RepID=A0A226DJB3_FOLCA|nr:hypothetical protein Fcan01_19896 [Folsomia candida]
MPNLTSLHIYQKVFLFYFKYPYFYNTSARRFETLQLKDLLYTFYLPEFLVFSSVLLSIAELVSIACSEKIHILQVLLYSFALILSTFNISTVVAISIVKREYVAFCNDLLLQAELLEKDFAKRVKKWDKLTIILTNFVLASVTLPFVHAIFEAYLTVNDKFGHLQYTFANSICPLNTYFACKAITFIILTIWHALIAFNDTAVLVASVINGALVLKMLIDSVGKLGRMAPSLHSIRVYQRFCILNKNLESISTTLAFLLLSLGFGFTVTCNFVTVRMFAVIRMPFYLFFPMGSLVAMVGIGILLPYGIACHELSRKLLVGWRKTLGSKRGSMRFEEKIGKGLRPIGIKVGSGEFSLFVLKKSTKSTYYVAVMNTTIDALMTKMDK